METAVTPESLPLVMWLLGFYYFLPALVVAAVLLGVPALRRRKATRWIGLAAAGVACLFPLSGLITLIQFGAIMGMHSAGQARRTHRLKTPQQFAGILFPAGSTVTLDEHDPNFIESATLSRPTQVRGLPLTGTFSMPANQDTTQPAETGALSGTLAQAGFIGEIPCAPGPINLNASFTSCILDRSATINGFPLAAHSYVQTRRQPSGDLSLEQASLAAPVTLFGTIYPAATIFTPGVLAARTIANQTRLTSGIMLVCLPAGAELKLGRALLHGPLTVEYSNTVRVSQYCPYTPNDQDQHTSAAPAGYLQLGQTRSAQGSYDPITESWTDLAAQPLTQN